MPANTDLVVADLAVYFGTHDAQKILARVQADPMGAWFAGDFGNLLKYAAYHIDTLGGDVEDLQGPEKKKALAKWLDDIFVFEGWMEKIDGWLFRKLADYGIDWAVAQLKKEKKHDTATVESTAGAGAPDGGMPEH